MRTFTVPAGEASISQVVREAFKTSNSNYFLTSDGLQFYVKKEDGEIQMLNNIHTREAESRSFTVPLNSRSYTVSLIGRSHSPSIENRSYET